MDCNKEEAIRAKTLAEKKMENKDFHGAHKIALRAQQLYSDLENISQMLLVCEIHCYAEKKFLGIELDWYGILQVERTADEATIKKQYRKFALQLHPDKNKFPGAEAAFKLIGEAQGILLDKEKRRVHDKKWNAHLAGVRDTSFSRAATTNQAKPKDNSIPSSRQEKNFRENFASFNIHCPRQPPPPPQTGFPYIQPTFWTICPFCSVRYQYHKGVVNKSIICQNCLKNFIAYDLNIPGVSPFTNVDMKKPHERRSPEQKPFPNHGYSKVDLGRKGSSTAETRRSEVPQTTGNQGVAPSSCKVNSRKRRKRGGEESSESINSEGSTESLKEEEVVAEGGHFQGNQKSEQPVRRSGRQRQKVSYKDSLSEDDEEVVVSPQMDEENGHPPDKENNPLQSDASKPAKLDGEQVEKDKKSAVFYESKLSEEDSVSTEAGEKPETYEYPDPDFHDFDKDRQEGCFSVGQIWAAYDSLEGMPRFYARIRKVVSPGFKLKVTWLEPFPDKKDEKRWVSKNLPVSCGKFVLGDTEEIEDRIMFSHRMYFEQVSNKVYIIYPNKGETWAIFKNWDIGWYSDPDSHKKNEYEFVEILSEYDVKVGINVAYLCKVKSFTSVFARTSSDRNSSFQISPEELYRFSHRIPSFKLTGEEREGVPKGCFELDPASISLNMEEIDLSDDHGHVDEVRAQWQPSHTDDKVTQVYGTHVCGSDVGQIQIPDSEFHNFDVSKSPKNFQIGQVWALYSDEDSLPKYYCQIAKVISSPQFKLHIRWLSLCMLPKGVTGWKDKDMPMGCGIFKVKRGNRDIYTSTASFSHCMKAECGKHRTFEIFPEKGDVWALYKHWNLNMNRSDLENSDYIFAEVIERNDSMVRVSVLERVDGFNSVFKYQLKGRSQITLKIPIAEILKFSHQVPAIQLSEERNGSLRGCWELDPAALPVHFFRSN
ncbi:hypothetical protein SAY87_009297 [Trapa incisa]|uniref:J domain-containing protein n=1 Tax=Trapa incisa TaxID=236973 RepID=A0AAN7Q2D2_9MYRT|nr:hypothetical protein SAY87_009297 [Trapa incisa]